MTCNTRSKLFRTGCSEFPSSDSPWIQAWFSKTLSSLSADCGVKFDWLDTAVLLAGGLEDAMFVDVSLLLELPPTTSSSSASSSGRLSSCISSTAGFERFVVDESGLSPFSDMKILPLSNNRSPAPPRPATAPSWAVPQLSAGEISLPLCDMTVGVAISSSSLLSSKSFRPTFARGGTDVADAPAWSGKPVAGCRVLLPPLAHLSRRMCSMSGTCRAPSPDSKDWGKYRGLDDNGDGRVTGLGVVKRDEAGDTACIPAIKPKYSTYSSTHLKINAVQAISCRIYLCNQRLFHRTCTVSKNVMEKCKKNWYKSQLKLSPQVFLPSTYAYFSISYDKCSGKDVRTCALGLTRPRKVTQSKELKVRK